MNPKILLLLLLLVGCDEASKSSCDGLSPRFGEELTLQLVTLGYADISYDSGGPGDTWQAVITEQAAWDAQVATWGSDGGLSPDFSTEAVFVNAWVFGGCNEEYRYAAWRWDDTIRVRADYHSELSVCEAYFPKVDVMVVPTGGSTALDWCE